MGYIVEIKEKNGRWEPVRQFKKVKIGRIDGLKANTEYFVRIMAENEYLSKSKYSKEIEVIMMPSPLCAGVERVDADNLMIELSSKELIGLSQIGDGMNAMLQINLTNLENDEKSEWMNVSAIKTADVNKYNYELKGIQTRSWNFYNVRFKIECIGIGYTEYGQTYTFAKTEVEKAKDVELEVHKYRGYYSYKDWYYPKYLLEDSNGDEEGKYYGSKLVKEFGKNENDWLVFKMKENFILTRVAIQQRRAGYTQRVKQMKVFVGDGNKKWNILKSNGNEIIRCKDVKELQWHNLDGIDAAHKYVRIELLDNGVSNPNWSRFIFSQLKFKSF